MTDTTARLALPLLVPGQAQKEVFHNEALALLDLATQPSVVDVGTNTPPTAAVVGSAWIVGSTPTGDWAGRAGCLAGWTDGGWRFLSAIEGMTVWDQGSGNLARYVDSAWTIGTVAASRIVVGGVQVVGAQQAAIAAPVGGAVVDAEARAITAIMLAALRAHGLIAG